MNGILSQIVALTAHGNDFLKNGKLPGDFYPNNTTFQFCNKIDFRKFKKSFFTQKTKEVIVADNPDNWFRQLKKEKCKELRLYFENSKDQSFAKDYKLAGLVGGGGSWLIEAVYDNYSNYWANHWEVTKQDEPNSKIWTVNYGMNQGKQRSNNLQIDQTKIKEGLEQTLTEIAEFAFNQNLEEWGNQFEKARSVLSSDIPQESYYHYDLIPVHNYSLMAQQILFCAGSAWVFGGMGSWNDLGFANDQSNEMYEKLSETLYSNINDAVISAINSY